MRFMNKTVFKQKFFRLWLVSVAKQAGLCLTWSCITEGKFSHEGARLSRLPNTGVKLEWQLLKKITEEKTITKFHGINNKN